MTEGILDKAKRTNATLQDLEKRFELYRDELERPTFKRATTTATAYTNSTTYVRLGEQVSLECPAGSELEIKAKITIDMDNTAGAGDAKHWRFKLVRSDVTGTILDFDRKTLSFEGTGSQYDSVTLLATDRPPAGKPARYEVMVVQSNAADARIRAMEQYWEIKTRRSRVGKDRTV